MDAQQHSFKKAFFWGLLFVPLTLLFFIFSYGRKSTVVVFCDVGQGDGAYIRTLEGTDIVVDAGLGNSMLECLGKYMPFWDRTIELAFLSHPQNDHYGGFEAILNRYAIDYFIGPSADNDNKSYHSLIRKLTTSNTIVKDMYGGETINLGEQAYITIYWPTRQFVAINTNPKTDKNNNKGIVLGSTTTSEDLNSFSSILKLTDGDFDVLFTGDSTPDVLTELYKDGALKQNLSSPLEVLKVPHHGSKNGLTEDFLKLADPSLSVISVAKKNKYGHPSKSVIDMFEALNKKYLMTATSGTIIIKAGKHGWQVR